jgi:hypothetical protein
MLIATVFSGMVLGLRTLLIHRITWRNRIAHALERVLLSETFGISDRARRNLEYTFVMILCTVVNVKESCE